MVCFIATMLGLASSLVGFPVFAELLGTSDDATIWMSAEGWGLRADVGQLTEFAGSPGAQRRSRRCSWPRRAVVTSSAAGRERPALARCHQIVGRSFHPRGSEAARAQRAGRFV
jgi:hypothetical protein